VAPRGTDNVWVLIHSPLVGPTTWRAVARELERSDHRALVPSLLGVAHAPVPQWRHSLDAVRAATKGLEGPLVLVGHSGAGALLPPIAEAVPGDVAGLVFVDAALPPASGSAPLAPAEFMQQLRALVIEGVLPRWSRWFGEEGVLGLVRDEGLRAHLEQEMPRLPLSYFEASVPMPDGWDQGPCAYLLLSSDEDGKSAADARARGWPVAEIRDAHHLTLVTDPAAVSGALLRLEREICG
jgi:pimeloyl-ACP methyl ester carboxylesterase